jgi:hypothetical protein
MGRGWQGGRPPVASPAEGRRDPPRSETFSWDPNSSGGAKVARQRATAREGLRETRESSRGRAGGPEATGRLVVTLHPRSSPESRTSSRAESREPQDSRSGRGVEAERTWLAPGADTACSSLDIIGESCTALNISK